MQQSFHQSLLSYAFKAARLKFAGAASTQYAEDGEAVQETATVTCNQGKLRSVQGSPVPIDVFSETDPEAVAYTDTIDSLKTLLLINYNAPESASEVDALFNAESQLDFLNSLPNWHDLFGEYLALGSIGETCCGRLYGSDPVVDWRGGYYYAKSKVKVDEHDTGTTRFRQSSSHFEGAANVAPSSISPSTAQLSIENEGTNVRS